MTRHPPLDVRTSADVLGTFDLEAHAILDGVPLHDLNVIDLPGGGDGRTLADVRALTSSRSLERANPVVRFLFGLRGWLGRVFRWDRPEKAARHTSFAARLQ
jgi:hypothetical protein